jgi:hypothetical protein
MILRRPKKSESLILRLIFDTTCQSVGKSYNIEFRMQKIPTHRFQKSPGLSSGHSALRHNAAA